MISKQLQFIVTFDTTADAIAMENACIDNALPGRLIPVPTVVSAGCGLAWCTDISCQEDLEALIKCQSLKIHEAILCVI